MAEASFSPADATGKRGGVRALHADSGELRWLYQTIPEPNAGQEDGASVWSSISVDVAAGMVLATTGNNFTIAGPNGDAFHAIDLASGTRRWVKQVRAGDVFTAAAALAGKDTSKFDFDFGANPILAEIAGRRVVAAGDKGGSFWVLDRETGEIIWRRDDLSASADATFGGILMNGAFDGRAFYVVSNDAQRGGATLHRLDAARGTSTWMHAFQETTWGAPSLANGLLFVPNNTQLYVLNAETGEQLNRFETGGTMVGGAPAIAQGNVVVKSGFLYVDPNTRLNDQVICYALPGTTSQGAAGASGSSAPPPAAASFSAVYRSLIVGTGCNTGQCHSAAAAGGTWPMAVTPTRFW
jgi:outer membrane protein assembly factor BamB